MNSPVKILLFLLFTGCASNTVQTPATHAMPAGDGDGSDPNVIVRRATEIHGGAGPFVVAGYRIGHRALRELGLSRGSFDVEVRHESPREVQFSCIADGAQAATGASVGRLNLLFAEAPRDALRTIVRDRRNGRSVAFRLRPGFLERFLNTPRPQLGAAGRVVASLADDEIFQMEPVTP